MHWDSKEAFFGAQATLSVILDTKAEVERLIEHADTNNYEAVSVGC